MNDLTRWFVPVLLCAALSANAADSLSEAEYFYQKNGSSHRYFVTQTGDNFSFKFETDPGDLDERFKAGLHVLDSLYHDRSIEPESKRHYIKERANCYALDSSFHTYSLCLLPNEFSTDSRDRFRGFVTQMPNWKWMVVYNLLPALVFLGLLFFFTKNNTD